MPETYGLPEPPSEVSTSDRVEQLIAGQSVVRRIVLYLLVGVLVLTPVPGLAVLPLLLLMATDHDLG